MKYQVHATGLTIEEIKSKNKNTLNLGLWCDPQANKKSLVEFDVNQKKKINLIKFTNTYISLLSKELNYYHNTNLSLNFWKHLLYPWVYSFITILYDRYFTIKKIKGKKNYSFIFQKSVKKFIFLKDHLEFRTLSQYDYLNSHIFYDLLKLFNFKTFTYKKINKRKELIDNLKKQNKYKFFFYKLKNLISSKEIVFYDTNLSIKKNFNICKNFFIYNNLSETNIKSNIDLDFRKKILANEGSIYNKDFIYYLDKMILKYLPKSYLEDFKNHYHGKLNRELPKKPKIIVTNISHITDDSFKIWFAKKREENSNIKLIVNQHGSDNHYEYAPIYIYNENICDAYLNWGNFSELRVKKFVTGVNLKKKNYLPKKNILYVCNSVSKYYCENISYKAGPSYIEQVEYEKKFFLNLDDKVLSNIDIKPYFHEFGWNFIQQLKKINNKINILDKNFQIDKYLSDYKLVICSQPSTTFFKSVCLKIPTICINSNFYKYNKFSKKIFNSFLKNNVAFNNPEKASKFINNNFNNFSKIFNSKKKQKSINNFRKNFVYDNKNYNLDLEKLLINYLNKKFKK